MSDNNVTENGIGLIKQGYTVEQVKEIEKGIESNINVLLYMDKSYMPIQMRQIRIGLEENLPVEVYAHTYYDWFQMVEIRKGLKEKLDVAKYASKDIPFDKMREIRRGLETDVDMLPYIQYPANIMREIRKSLERDIDIFQYIDEGYDTEQLEIIRQSLQKGIDIEPYISKEIIGPAIREIMLGLEAMQNVELYARADFSWQQMREIRLGLKNRVNTDIYNDPFYNWKQMRQIRLGLEIGLDVSKYSSYMYTSKEMSKIRNKMILMGEDTRETYIEDSHDLIIKITADELKAKVKILHAGKNYTRNDIVLELSEYGICDGLIESAINRLLNQKGNDEYITVAKGIMPEEGKDGWYEFFFDVENKIQPKVLPDGSVDYQQAEWYQAVLTGERIAYYHPASMGKDGKTVTGKVISANKGREKEILVLEGCSLLEDGRTYVANHCGKVEFKNDKLIVKNVLELDEVTLSTGNVDFKGNIYIKGNVGSGTVVKADGDIIIGGYVEAATIISGGNIEIRLGVNASEKGYIEAKGNVAAKYFENATIYAKENISANYILNSETYADECVLITGKKGTITGGYTYARAGLKSDNLGNSMRTTTKVCVGVSDEMFDELQKYTYNIKEIKNEISTLNKIFEELNYNYTAEEREEMDIYKKVEKSILVYENKLIKAVEEKKKQEDYIDKIKLSKIEVKGILNEGVEIDINGVKWIANETKNVVVENKNSGIEVNKLKK